MSLPDQTPKLPKTPFLIGDAALLGAAWFIATRHAGALSNGAIIGVVVCVALASLLGAIPFLADYARRQDEALDERQRGLDALARTVAASSEQISIAANGLHEIAELAQKNLKHAEQLPHKLQEKIAEFNAQLASAQQDEKEEIEKELAELRGSETERLQAVADKVHKALGELTKLEAAVQKRLSSSADDAAKAQVAALSEKLSEALAQIDAKLTSSATLAAATLEAAVTKASSSAHVAAIPTTTSPVASTSAAAAGSAPVLPESHRSRTVRADEVPASQPAPASAATSAASPTPETPGSQPNPKMAPVNGGAESEEGKLAEPPPLPPEVTGAGPIAPGAVDAPSPEATAAAVQAAALNPPPGAPPPPTAEMGRPPKKRAPKKPALATPPSTPEPAPAVAETKAPEPKPADTGELSLDLPKTEHEAPVIHISTDDTPVSQSEAVEKVISSDGATRLIVTAYIGIGNRLFVRGEGPGLSWEKGVPLQFVSIGKWRWETSDATGPVKCKLYKNDETECSALGTLVLDPGHQQEVTAKF